MKKILFVCNGNTCRSPMAVCILKNLLKKEKLLDEFEICSAGINAENNRDMNELAKKALRKYKIPVLSHSSQRLEEKHILGSDLVVTMTTEQKEFLSNYKNVFSIKDLTKAEDVLDPFGQEYECYLKVCEDLIKNVKTIYNLLVEKYDIYCK